MRSRPVEPARIEHGEPPFAPDYGDLYHPRVGALEQARHVFIGGNGLPARWQGRERFVILETGFGLGNNFIATWDAWRNDAARCRQLVFASVEKHPPRRDDLEQVHRASPLSALARALVAAWPPLVPGLHVIDFEGGRVRLLLAFGDVTDWLPELVLAADAIYLDGFAPARNPAMWDPRVLKAVGRRAAAGATAATWSVARELREGLVAAGFEVERAPGVGGKREITCARFAPRDGRQRTVRALGIGREVAVVGAGLAGAAVANALAAEGLSVTVFDRRAGPGAETSGNPGGLFHGTVHADDGPHARLLRAAALFTSGMAGQASGLLRLSSDALDRMRSHLDIQRLPPDWVQALDATQASALAGVTLYEPAWFFPRGGWLAPGRLVATLLQPDGIRFVGDMSVDRIEAQGSRWRLLDPAGASIAAVDAVVVANAGDALRLLAPFGFTAPLVRRRGQVSWWPGFDSALRLPLAGDGYALPHPGGLLFGATDTADDECEAIRESDHATNVERLRRLTGIVQPTARAWQGRVGWRVQAEDRMPIAGPVPPAGAAGSDQARRWPRIGGLFVCTALGGRGITLAPLLGRLVAAQVAGSVLPLEQSLVDAVDPVRWRVRALRRQG